MRAQIRAWDSVRFLHPDAYELLDTLRGMGLKVGYVSNTLDPPRILREVMDDEGMAQPGRRDRAVVASSGYRKPSPRSTEPPPTRSGSIRARTLFVGDRVLEDVVGPKREGMTAVLAEWFRDDEGDHTPGRPPREGSAGGAGDRCSEAFRRRRPAPTSPVD